MKQSWREECGVMGVWNHPDAARLVYLGLYSMQHRGQESAGIVSLRDEQHIHHKGLGLVGDVFSEHDLERLRGKTAIGHVRYSTTGQNLLTNAQPLTANLLNGPVAVAHNGNIVNHQTLREELRRSGAIFHGTNDTEILLHLLSKHKSKNFIEALQESVQRIEGAYSFVILNNESMVAVRDPWGFRPLVLGKVKQAWGESYVVASETCAFDLIGAELVREIEPGEMWWVDASGAHSKKISERPRRAHCIFEHIYFSRPDSVVFGHSVYEARKKFGARLAVENPIDADVVIPVPDSGVAAAIGYAQQSGIPFEMGIIRNHYVGRTFIQPQQNIRDFGVKIKLNPLSEVLKNKRVVVIDDSLVRGTTSRKIVSLIRSAGAKEVHVRIASPPTVGPCYYGVDTPHREQLIAANKSVEEICKFIEADSLSYLTIQGLFASLNSSGAQYCAACFDGNYPVLD